MDDASPANLAALQDVAHTYVTKNAALLNQIAALLKPLRGSALPGIGKPKRRSPPASSAQPLNSSLRQSRQNQLEQLIGERVGVYLVHVDQHHHSIAFFRSER